MRTKLEGETFLPKSCVTVKKHSVKEHDQPPTQSAVCTQPGVCLLTTHFLSLPDPVFPVTLGFAFFLPVLLVSAVRLMGGRKSGRDGLAFQGLSEQVRGVSCVLCRNWCISANQNFALSWKLH